MLLAERIKIHFDGRDLRLAALIGNIVAEVKVREDERLGAVKRHGKRFFAGITFGDKAVYVWARHGEPAFGLGRQDDRLPSLHDHT
jgi:hypothetical protein